MWRSRELIQRFAPVAVLLMAGVATTVIIGHRLRAAPESVALVGRTIGEVPTPARAGLLLVTSPTCRFCEASLPFYRELAGLSGTSTGLLSLRALVLPPDQAAEYLDSRDLLWTPSSLDSRTLEVPGTPTLLLLDSAGRVTHTWVGLLNQTQRQEVINAVRALCPDCAHR